MTADSLAWIGASGVERTFGWLMLHRRLARDYETNPQRSRSMIHWAMIDNMSRRLTGESTGDAVEITGVAAPVLA